LEVRLLWFTEYQTENLGLSFKVRSAKRVKSKFQEILLLDTYEYGKMLVLDGAVQTTEKDEFIYHEMIAHVPAVSIGRKLKKVLVIGGGDGGTVREVLKHNPERVDLVEIDREVVDFCMRELPTISSALDDERVNIYFEDGRDFVKNTEVDYDMVVVDCSDPVGPSKVLFESDFYKDVASILTDDGVFVTQSESPLIHKDTVPLIFKELKSVFKIVKLYLAFIPTYPAGMWSFTFASNSVDPIGIDKSKVDFAIEKIEELSGSKLKYYNCDIHFGAFSLPEFVKERL
jgi:spermidine synthase